MLYFRVFATHQSRSSLPAPFSFLPCSHSTLLFSEDYALLPATGVPQPFVYQSLPHSFHRDGGCTPSRHRHRDEKPVTASPLESAFTNPDARNSFRMRIYENSRVYPKSSHSGTNDLLTPWSAGRLASALASLHRCFLTSRIQLSHQPRNN